MSIAPENNVNLWPTPNEAPLTPQQIDLRHANSLLERALNQVERGEIDKALLGCRQAVHLTPEAFAAHSLLAMLLRRTDALDEAIIHSEKAHALLPDNYGEKERLAILHTARDNAQTTAPLQFGEWDKFRLELQSEIKLSLMLEPQTATLPPLASNEPLPFANDPLLTAPEAAPVLEPPADIIQAAPPTSRKQSQNYFFLMGLAALAAILSFLLVRGMQQKASVEGTPQPPATQITESNTSQPPGDLIPQNNQPVQASGDTPSASPVVNDAVTPTANPQVSSPATIQPIQETRSPAPRPSNPAPVSQAASRLAPASRPAATIERQSNTRTAIPAPPPPISSEDAPARPRTPAREEEVGPRFSSPAKTTEENAAAPQRSSEDVGPRFSQP